MSRSDYILLTTLVSMLIAIVAVCYAPVADDATLTMRLWAISASPLFLGIISTAIAAFAGTWGAQALAERTSQRRDLLSEIRGTNTALGLVFNIANMYITAKRQHISGIIHEYEVQSAKYADSEYTRLVELDLRTLYPPKPPIDDLSRLLREKITAGTSAIVLFTQLSQSVQDLSHTISERNKWIDEIRKMPEELFGSHDRKARMFLGIPLTSSLDVEQTDNRYTDYIAALRLQVNDCIAFNIILSKLLTNHGRALARKYGKEAPQIHELKLTGVEEYLPDMKPYQSWEKIAL